MAASINKKYLILLSRQLYFDDSTGVDVHLAKEGGRAQYLWLETLESLQCWNL